MDALTALRGVDESYWAQLTPRWFDLRDFASAEVVAFDGDALLSSVLDEPSLALGKAQDPLSFQLGHALFELENRLAAFIKREVDVQIVFFESNKAISTRAGSVAGVVAACTLFRAVAIKHLERIPNLVVRSFASLDDPAWIEYRDINRPCLVLTSSGGVAPTATDELVPERKLIQRAFLHTLHSRDMGTAELSATVFKDAKIFAFVYTNRAKRLIVPMLLPDVEKAIAQAHTATTDAATAVPGDLAASSLPALAAAKHLLASRSDPTSVALAYLFVAHAMALEGLPIETLAEPVAALHPDLFELLASAILPSLLAAMASVEAGADDAALRLPLDGRLFAAFVRAATETASDGPTLLGATLHGRVEKAWAEAQLPMADLSTLASQFPAPAPTANGAHADDDASNARVTVLPFSHPVFDEHLVDVKVPEGAEDEAEPLESSLDEQTVFSTEPWKNGKPILAKYEGAAPPMSKAEKEALAALPDWLRARKAKRALRNEQMFAAQMQRSAASLTGAKGAQLVRQAIAPTGRTVADLANLKPVKVKVSHTPAPSKKAAKEGKEKKAPAKSKAEMIRAQNSQAKGAKTASGAESWWADQMAQLGAKLLPVRIENLEKIMAASKHRSDPWVGAEAKLYRIDLEIRTWVADTRNRATSLGRIQYQTWIAREGLELFAHKALNKAQRKHLTNIFNALGLKTLIPPEPTSAPADIDAGIMDRPLSFDALKVRRKRDDAPTEDFFPIEDTPTIFQLKRLGQYMERSLDSRPDPRVNFEPDGWQIRVLDAVDERKSMLVVAPTSAGKTFCSFSAMEQTLRASDDGVVVYVAPTKALVNQVAAEVYARFSKTIQGGSLWAIHTGDYRVHAPAACQILVTVPAILQQMLLSPVMAKAWTPRLRWIIFDEIHAIDADEDSIGAWEQLLIQIPCPLIGLSATVGQPERFAGWLEKVQEAHGIGFELVLHTHRYNALRKHVYTPSQAVLDKPFAGFAPVIGEAAASDLTVVHPVAALSPGLTRLPDELPLEPIDCLTLHAAMDKIDKLPASLEPNTFFKSTPVIRMVDIYKYEAALKDVLAGWLAQDGASRDESMPFLRVVRALQADVRERVEPIATKLRDESLGSVFMPLLNTLHASDNLPAILFAFDRKTCEDIGQELCSDLEAAEEKWRATSPVWKAKLAAVEAYQKNSKAREERAKKMAAAKAKKPKGAGDKDQEQGTEIREDTIDSSWEASFDPELPSPEFSFTPRRNVASQDEVDAAVNELKSWSGEWLVPRFFVDCLRRGIGIHHAGANRRYRTAVETLFRVGHLRVVIATGTLALGVNMPTRTVVFAGDSAFLTALNFRQAAGRAGRRGFDTLGKVVFAGISFERIQRLLVARLPALGGAFPLSTSLVLRLAHLLHESNNAPVAVTGISTMLKLDRLSVATDLDRTETLHFLRFNIEYLRRAGLIDAHGVPLALFGLAAQLSMAEPANFSFVALVRSGVLHKIAETFATDEAGTIERFLHVIAHLFGRIRLLAEHAKPAVVLAPLPDDCAAVLRAHERLVKDVFVAHATSYARLHVDALGAEDVLPLSKLRVGGKTALEGGVATASGERTAPTVRSVFAATSGLGDSFANLDELDRTSRAGIHLHTHAVPSLDTFADQRILLNSYILDFMRHGTLAPLVDINGINAGDVWYILKDFSTVLSTIRTVIEKMLKLNGATDDGDYEESAEPAGGGGDERAGADEPNARAEIARPPNTTDADWAFYCMCAAAQASFDAKFHKTWA